MITMILGGLWHGANWTFLIWGGLHGIGQVVGHLRRTRRVALGLPTEPIGWRRWLSVFWTFQFVCLAWVFFRATSASNAFAMLGRLISGWGAPSPLVTVMVVLTVLAVLAVQQLPERLGDRLVAELSQAHVAVQVGLGSLTLLIITTLGPVGVAPFIYYRF